MMNRSEACWPPYSAEFDEARALHHRPEQHAADGDTRVARKAAENEHRIAEEGEGRVEHAGVEVGDVQRDEEARDRRDRRGDGRATAACRTETFLPSAAAASSSSRIALSTRPQGVPCSAFRPPTQGQKDQPDRRSAAAAASGRRDRAAPDASEHPGRDGAPFVVEAHDALVAAGELGVLQRVAHDLGERDRRDGEIVRAQAQRRDADEHAGNDREQRCRPAAPPRATSRR